MMHVGVVLRLAALCLLLASPGHTAPAQELVDVELVLAVDVSQSMDHDERLLQRDGYVRALAHPDLAAAIAQGVYGRIAITYVEWAGPGAQQVLLPWTLIEDEATARRAAAALDIAPLQGMRGTSISGALDFASSLFEDNRYEGLRRIIDVSGDGPNNLGGRVEAARDAALARGIIINGLPIMLHGGRYDPWSIPDLDIYYSDCVVGGPASFVLPVHEEAQLHDAIRQKLVLEVAAAPARLVPAGWGRQGSRIDCLIGERLRQQWMDP